MRDRIKKYTIAIIVALFSFLISVKYSYSDLLPSLRIPALKIHTQVYPRSKIWKRVPSIIIPLNIQLYSVKKVQVKGFISGDKIYIRLKWLDTTNNSILKGPRQFLDGCAISFPIKRQKGFAPSICMGQIGNMVNIWHWRANLKNNKAINLIAGGPGTLTEVNDPNLHQRSIWSGGYWYVEFYRPLKDNKGVNLMKDKSYYIAVAIWNGSDHERAMMKSVSNWFKIDLK